MFEFKKFKILVCAGSGGVGKTTVSAALGILAAQQGLRVLVLTIDPAKRLANALGLEVDEIPDAVKVPGQNYKGALYAAMVEPKKVFDDFIRKNAPNKGVVEKLLQNSLYKQLSTTLSGSQEFTSLEMLLSAYQSGKYDLVILDTPP
ncbi:MAG: AAA family ATPase, partial [Bdellovibrionales bacterium]|nr:AAA family ATPase [Bdellovibrionales bacterium]